MRITRNRLISGPPFSPDIVKKPVNLKSEPVKVQPINLLHLPDEIIVLILQPLPKIHLLRSVAPLCRRLQSIVYGHFFKNFDFGHDWCQWYRFSDEFFSQLPSPKQIKFVTSEELEYTMRNSCTFHVGQFGRPPDDERRRLVSAMRRGFQEGLLHLSLKYCYVDGGETRNWQSERRSVKFLQCVLRGCAQLEELTYNVQGFCIVMQTYFDITPRFHEDHVLAIVDNCPNLKVLSIGNELAPNALYPFLSMRAPLTELSLDKCSLLSNANLYQLRNLRFLKSLSLRDLTVCSVTDFGLGLFFDRFEMSSKLTSLTLGFNAGEHMDLNPVFKACHNLEELRLTILLHDDFNLKPLTKLRVFHYHKLKGCTNEFSEEDQQIIFPSEHGG